MLLKRIKTTLQYASRQKNEPNNGWIANKISHSDLPPQHCGLNFQILSKKFEAFFIKAWCLLSNINFGWNCFITSFFLHIPCVKKVVKASLIKQLVRIFWRSGKKLWKFEFLLSFVANRLIAWCVSGNAVAAVALGRCQLLCSSHAEGYSLAPWLCQWRKWLL